jgi:hypothetical protein
MIAITGVLSTLTSHYLFNRCIAPGPEVARHDPSFPVYFAYAQAIPLILSYEYKPNLALSGSIIL